MWRGWIVALASGAWLVALVSACANDEKLPDYVPMTTKWTPPPPKPVSDAGDAVVVRRDGGVYFDADEERSKQLQQVLKDGQKRSQDYVDATRRQAEQFRQDQIRQDQQRHDQEEYRKWQRSH